MIKQHRLLWIICSFILVAVLAFGPGRWLRRAAANVTLVSFTANTLTGQPKVYINWETATEFNTAGFYVTRSDSVTSPFVRLFTTPITSKGDEIRGAEYPWVDDTAVLNQTYYYKLEEITTNQQSEFYGPITVTAGVNISNIGTPTSTTRSATATRTPTVTPSSTATPTTQQSANSSVSTTSSNSIVLTPRLATGATITPQPSSLGNVANFATPIIPPTSARSDAAVPPAVPFATAVLPVVDAITAVAVAPPPQAVPNSLQPQSPDPTLVPTNAAPAEVKPVVVVTEAASGAPTFGSASAPPLLVVAAFLFLGLAFVILRQIRQ